MEIIGYTIEVTREDFEAAKSCEPKADSFWLGWILSRAKPQFVIGKNEVILDEQR